MASLRCPLDGSTFLLRPTTTLGRGADVALRLDHPSVSALHALVAWSGNRWTVRDLGSRNGTFLDGGRLPVGTVADLVTGAQIRLGHGPVWEVVDTSPPSASGTHPDGRVAFSVGGLLLLPDSTLPSAMVHLAGGRWWLEQEGTTSPIEDGATVSIGGTPWVLSLPTVPARTEEGRPPVLLREATLEFVVSADEEHVQLSLACPTSSLSLLSRAHHYLLLTLARARLQDRAAGRSPAEEGWRDFDRLARGLGLAPSGLYVQTFRARAQLADAGVEDAAGIIERRGLGTVRLGPVGIRITRA